MQFLSLKLRQKFETSCITCTIYVRTHVSTHTAPCKCTIGNARGRAFEYIEAGQKPRNESERKRDRERGDECKNGGRYSEDSQRGQVRCCVAGGRPQRRAGSEQVTGSSAPSSAVPRHGHSRSAPVDSAGDSVRIRIVHARAFDGCVAASIADSRLDAWYHYPGIQ